MTKNDYTIKLTEMVPVKRDICCNHCEGTHMERANNLVYATNPPQYEYICPKCKRTTTATECFPTIEFIPRNELGDDGK